MICPRCFKEIGMAQSCPSCGFSFEKEEKRREKANALPLFYRLANRYEIGELLGAGGFGITYLAREIESGEILAVKEFFPSHICARGMDGEVVAQKNREGYETSVRHFFEEARTLYRLKNCPSVVCVKAFFRSNNTAYIVMEYIKGKSLTAYADEVTKKIPYTQAKNFTIQIALALSEVHSAGMIHSDISPANVLIDEQGNVKLIDFGASRSFLEKDGDELTRQLKPGYAPPEQYCGSDLPIGPWTDIYELAATFYRMVLGEVPPPATERRDGEKLKKLRDWVPEAEEKVDACISRALSLNYKKRYSDVNEFIADFSDFSAEENKTNDNNPVLHNAADGIRKKISRLFGSITPELRKKPKDSCVALAEIVEGKNKGKQYRLEAGRQYFAGRQSDMCDIVISDESIISRIHAVITCAADGKSLTVADRSRNGLSINNGAKLNGQSVTVRDNCILNFSDGAALMSIIWNQRMED